MNTNSKGMLCLPEILTTLITMTLMFFSSSATAQQCSTFIQKGDKFYANFEILNALEEYQQAYELCPDSFEVLASLTNAYNDYGEELKDDKSDKAEKYLEKAVQYAEALEKKFPNKAETYYFLAATYGNLSLYKGGKDQVKLARYVEQNAKRAIELNPNFAPAYVALGIFYREVADLSWAIKTFAKALYGDLPEGTFEDAIKMFLKASELSPDSIYPHFDMGVTYEKMDQKEKALEEYKKVIELPVQDHQDNRKKAKAQKRVEELNGAK